MIIIDKRKLKFLLAGRTYDIPVPNPHRYRRGRDYAISTSHNKPHTHRVEILEIGEATVRVRLAANIEPTRWLARYSQYGYTTHPARAMRNEPPAVTAGDQADITRQAHLREQDLANRGRSIGIRLKEAAWRHDFVAFRELHAELGAITPGVSTAFAGTL